MTSGYHILLTIGGKWILVKIKWKKNVLECCCFSEKCKYMYIDKKNLTSKYGVADFFTWAKVVTVNITWGLMIQQICRREKTKSM